MRHGPVDVLVLAFGEPKPDGSIGAELRRLVESGTIRVLDAMILTKTADSEAVTLDLEDLPDDERAAYGFIDTGTRGLFDSVDADALKEGMVPGSAVLAIAIEHTWALGLRDALEKVGGQVAMDVRIPAAVVDDTYASVAV